MATDLERLVVQLSADIKGYENALKKARGATVTQTRHIERRFERMNKNVSAGFVTLGRSLAGALAVAGGIRGMQSLLDASTRIDNALKVAGHSGEELDGVFNRLRASAERNAVSLEAMVTLYSRLKLVQKDLGASQSEIEQFSNRVGMALRASGQSAEAARGAMLQLGQAMSTGVVRSEEYNSLQEGAVPILRAVAAGLKEAGGSVGTLTSLVKSGQVSSEAFFRAFEAGTPLLEGFVKDAELTTTQAMENIRTALIAATRDFAEGSMAADSLADAFQEMADYINGIDFEEFGEEVRTLVGWIGDIVEAINQIPNIGAEIAERTGSDRIGQWIVEQGGGRHIGLKSHRTMRQRMGITDRDDAAANPGGLTPAQIEAFAGRTGAFGTVGASPKGGRVGSGEIKPVSLTDFDPPPGKTGSGGKGRSRGNRFAREIEQIKERTAALQAETAAMAGLNPLVDDYGFTLEKAAAKQELLAEAKRAGIEITPELRATIDQLAEGYAHASAEANILAESQDKVREAAEEMRDLGKDVMGGFIRDLQAGKSASEALAGALQKVADKLLDVALNSIFDGGGGLGGILGTLFGGGGQLGIARAGGIGLYHSGGVVGSPSSVRSGVHPAVFAGAPRYHDGGIAGLRPGEVPAILQRGELVIPKGGSMGAGGVNMTYAPVYHVAQGADPKAIADLQKAQAKDRAEFKGNVLAAVRDGRSRRRLQ